MAGPFTIQRVPRGLLDALAMKGSGQLPAELVNGISITLDASQLYLDELIRGTVTNTAVLAATGLSTPAAAVVPFGEMWLMQHLAISSTLMAAGEAYTLRPAIARNAFGVVELAPTEQTASGATERIGIGWDFTPAFKVLRPGDSYGLYISEVAAGAHAFSVHASYYRLLF